MSSPSPCLHRNRLIGVVLFLFVSAVAQAVQQIRRTNAVQAVVAVLTKKVLKHACTFSIGLCGRKVTLLSAIVACMFFLVQNDGSFLARMAQPGRRSPEPAGAARTERRNGRRPRVLGQWRAVLYKSPHQRVKAEAPAGRMLLK